MREKTGSGIASEVLGGERAFFTRRVARFVTSDTGPLGSAVATITW